jgi:hypothetical protein
VRVERKYRLETLVLLSAYVLTGLLAARTLLDPVLKGFLAVFTGWLILSVTVCGGWPLSYPLGAPKFGLLRSAALMTFILLSGSALSYAVTAMAGFDAFIFGSLLIAVSAVWGMAFEAWPLMHLNPKNATATAIPAAAGMAVALSSVAACVSRSLLLITLMTLLTTTFVFSPTLCFQGYPYYRLWRQPRIGLGVLLTGLFLGLTFSQLIDVGLPLGDGGITFLTDALSALLLWLVVLSWGLLYPLGLRKRQPQRGLITLALAVAAALPWTFFLRGLGVDALTFNLLFVLPLYVLHNSLWLRFPLKSYLLSSMVAQGQDSVEKLLDWKLQVTD